ncbi:MAG: DUF523 and DUF1722 domain-containing protein [Humidesulfovibrio sp.]|uniref:YbgA family protein n=1 Tax=Humidesulfovibrio sp. TaxID=2910988 RepID=UPI0027329503|nr:DUF523 and DUF1722 domain-containing protein [Humidesulfovibrio sp.]MDP2848938.1 DUF523 and DUF1722 domain-containing protein [Humidesulfovibrio sp.]
MVEAPQGGKPKIGISRCLLGENVRYDGGHKLDRYLRDVLGQHVEFVPVCPEVECGLTVPREAMRLVGEPEAPRLVTVKTRLDLTPHMDVWASERVGQLVEAGLCGFVFKYGSPSSGMSRVKVYPEAGGAPVLKGRGLFAARLMNALPLLPVEDEGRLNDPALRENFIESVFVMQRWHQLLARGFSLGRLVEFHTRHKLLVMAHSVVHYRSLGKLVAEGAKMTPGELQSAYLASLMEALRLVATVKKQVNVLSHAMGYFKRNLSPDEKRELIEVLDAYARELLPLIVPVTLLNHYVRKFGEAYLAGQWYLHPHPAELKLRNHV